MTLAWPDSQNRPPSPWWNIVVGGSAAGASGVDPLVSGAEGSWPGFPFPATTVCAGAVLAPQTTARPTSRRKDHERRWKVSDIGNHPAGRGGARKNQASELYPRLVYSIPGKGIWQSTGAR